MKYFKTLVCLLTLSAIITANKASAQLNGLQSIYFLNQYLANPALAGMEKGLNVNMGYRQQWTTIPGGPKLQSLTADYNSGNRVGLGISITNDQAGLISRTRIVGTYAYHLQLNDANDERLNFGVSFGAKNNYLDYSKVIGDLDDVQALNYNQQGVYLDGDLGIAYTSRNFNIQGALPNLKNVLSKTADELEVDRSVFYTAASYKMQDGWLGNFTLEPKVAYRRVKGFDNIFDAGFLLGMPDYKMNFTGFYHTNESLSLSLGLDLSKVDLLVSYTNNMGPLTAHANNTFELGVRLKLLRN